MSECSFSEGFPIQLSCITQVFSHILPFTPPQGCSWWTSFWYETICPSKKILFTPPQCLVIWFSGWRYLPLDSGIWAWTETCGCKDKEISVLSYPGIPFGTPRLNAVWVKLVARSNEPYLILFICACSKRWLPPTKAGYREMLMCSHLNSLQSMTKQCRHVVPTAKTSLLHEHQKDRSQHKLW